MYIIVLVFFTSYAFPLSAQKELPEIDWETALTKIDSIEKTWYKEGDSIFKLTNSIEESLGNIDSTYFIMLPSQEVFEKGVKKVTISTKLELLREVRNIYFHYRREIVIKADLSKLPNLKEIDFLAQDRNRMVGVDDNTLIIPDTLSKSYSIEKISIWTVTQKTIPKFIYHFNNLKILDLTFSRGSIGDIEFRESITKLMTMTKLEIVVIRGLKKSFYKHYEKYAPKMEEEFRKNGIYLFFI